MFETLQQYYDFLEQDKELFTNINISNAIVNVRDSSDDSDIKSQSTYEIYFNDLLFINGTVAPKIKHENGGDYPSLSLFDDGFMYIKRRALEIENPKYKARYYQLLWQSTHRHFDYAKNAIDNHFTFVTNASFAVDDHKSSMAYTIAVENLFALCQATDYRRDEILQLVISVIGNKKLDGYKEHRLMKFLAGEVKKKKQSDTLSAFYVYANHVLDHNVHPDLLEEFLELAISLSQKLNKSPKPYHNRLGEFFLAQAEGQKEKFIVHDLYLSALTQFRKAGNNQKVEEVTVMIEAAKKNLAFKSIRTEHTDEEFQSLWNAIVDSIDRITADCTSKDIYDYITLSDRIFPPASMLSETTTPTIFRIANVLTFDINRNVNRSKQGIINHYYVYVQNFSLRHLQLLFKYGIKRNKITFDSLIDHLKQYTWYGVDFTFNDSNGEKNGFDWIALMTPSLNSFFIQSEIDIKTNKDNYHNYILAVDSLTIKFEGLLREFSRNIGAQTIEVKPSGTQERISFDKLLENTKFKEVVPECDIALFKFLFTAEGMNLRNNIAHCFYTASKYSPGIMFMLIAALLKLGNYEFKPKPI